MSSPNRGLVLLSCGVTWSLPLQAQLDRRADAAVRTIVEASGIPGASVGLVKDGRVVWTAAYGRARLEPTLAADAAMAYPVGSISKQFTATCILLLQEDGKLRLDDVVARWFPALTQAGEVTLRELLSHTSGYRDYAPQDYTIPAWLNPVDPARLVAEWAGKPLDFAPGTQWQYSNTNFVLAALIVEKASGMRFMDFLRERVLQPLKLRGVLDLDRDTDRARLETAGYERRALGPLRPAALEAPGWYFGDGALAMPVATLLEWDIALMNRSLLRPESYEQLESAVQLRDGTPTRYGLGMSVLSRNGKLALEHSGEVGGFVAENIVLPGSRAAVAVLTNQEASPAARKIADALLPLLEEQAGQAPELNPAERQVRQILAGLQERKLDRGRFTADANYYFSDGTLDDFARSLRPLGEVLAVKETGSEQRGGMTGRTFAVEFASGSKVTVSTYLTKDGEFEQFLVF